MDLNLVKQKDENVLLFAEFLIDSAFDLSNAILTADYVLEACTTIIERTQAFHGEHANKALLEHKEGNL